MSKDEQIAELQDKLDATRQDFKKTCDAHRITIEGLGNAIYRIDVLERALRKATK